MITLQDLNRNGYSTTPEIDTNLNILLARINILEQEYGRDLVVTSGLRSTVKNKAVGGKSKSKHLIGAAVDISDLDGKFYDWCKASTGVLESVGFWCEERMGGWQHLQIIPPGSNHRWFFP